MFCSSWLLPKGPESRHSQPCHLLASCMLHQQQCLILFQLATPGPVPRTSLNFLTNIFFLQDVLPVSNALMCYLKVLSKSLLDNSQFVTQDDCLSKGKAIAKGLRDKGHPCPWGSSSSPGFVLPLTPRSQAKTGLEMLRESVPGPLNSYQLLHHVFQPKLGLALFVSRDILPCKSSPSSPDPWGIHTYTCFRLGIAASHV